MIPKTMATVQVKMNLEAFDHVLSLAKKQNDLLRQQLSEETSDEKFDRTIDSIHKQSVAQEFNFYDTLIAQLKLSLDAKRGA